MITNQFPNILYSLVNGTLVPVATITVGPDGALVIAATSGGGGGSGHFDSSGNPRVFDSVNNGWWTFTVPNGVPTLTAFSTNP